MVLKKTKAVPGTPVSGSRTWHRGTWYRSNSEEETLALARRIGKKLLAGTVVALVGEIGSGKTLFIKGLCRGLGVKRSNEVKSPTFVLLHLYRGRVPIQHFDLYRLENEKELDAIGFDDFLANTDAVSVIEWAERARRRIPKGAVWIQMKVLGPTSREVLVWGRFSGVGTVLRGTGLKRPVPLRTVPVNT